MRSVYVVFGAAGEYSDHREWPVAAYLDEEAAKKHVFQAATHYQAYRAKKGDHYYMDLPEPKANPYDSDMRGDYSGTNYYYYTVPLSKNIPMTYSEFSQRMADDDTGHVAHLMAEARPFIDSGEGMVRAEVLQGVIYSCCALIAAHHSAVMHEEPPCSN